MDFELKKVTNDHGSLEKIFRFKNTSYEEVLKLLVETFDGCVVTKVSNDPNSYIKPYKINANYILSGIKEHNC